MTLNDLGPSETTQILNEIELLKKLKVSDKVIQLIDQLVAIIKMLKPFKLNVNCFHHIK